MLTALVEDTKRRLKERVAAGEKPTRVLFGIFDVADLLEVLRESTGLTIKDVERWGMRDFPPHGSYIVSRDGITWSTYGGRKEEADYEGIYIHEGMVVFVEHEAPPPKSEPGKWAIQKQNPARIGFFWKTLETFDSKEEAELAIADASRFPVNDPMRIVFVG